MPETTTDTAAGLTAERIAELLGVCEAATSGPWWVEYPKNDDAYIACGIKGDKSETYALRDYSVDDSDLELMAAAREALPASLREALRLRAGMEAAAGGVCNRCRFRQEVYRDENGDWCHRAYEQDWGCPAGPIWDVLRPKEEG